MRRRPGVQQFAPCRQAPFHPDINNLYVQIIDLHLYSIIIRKVTHTLVRECMHVPE